MQDLRPLGRQLHGFTANYIFLESVFPHLRRRLEFKAARSSGLYYSTAAEGIQSVGGMGVEWEEAAERVVKDNSCLKISTSPKGSTSKHLLLESHSLECDVIQAMQMFLKK